MNQIEYNIRNAEYQAARSRIDEWMRNVKIETVNEDNNRLLNQMRRQDTQDSSIVTCQCGASFSWAGISDDLDQWLDQHKEHYL